jgi:hypothetical protein
MISLLHPSFGRPELARKCYDEWMGKAGNRMDIEYILCLSELDNITEYMNAFALTNPMITFISDKGLVKQVNHAASISTGNLLVAVSDDFGCPNNWDDLLILSLLGHSDYIVKTQDGLQPFIITLPIMDRAYYERFGYIYHPDYFHMHGDEELAHVGAMLGRTITLPLHFPHRHYSTGQMKKDATNIANDSYYTSDGITFKQRKAINFGL